MRYSKVTITAAGNINWMQPGQCERAQKESKRRLFGKTGANSISLEQIIEQVNFRNI